MENESNDQKEVRVDLIPESKVIRDVERMAETEKRLESLTGTGYKTRRKGMDNLQREKNGIWTMRFSVNGRRFCKTTGTTDRKRAEQILEKALAPLGLGKYRLSMMQVWRRYELSPKRRDQARATLESKRRVWHMFSAWIEKYHCYCTELHHITSDIIAEFLAEYRIDHTSGTYNSVVCVLREIFHTLATEAGIFDDPWEGVKLRDEDQHTRRELSMVEVQRLMLQACKLGDIWRKLFTIGLYTGLRLGDCCRLEWSSCLLDRGIIQVIPHKTRKHRHGRPVTIPIHPVLLDMLMETPSADQHGPVIPELHEWYESGKTHPIQHALKIIFHEAGIKTSVMVGGRKRATQDATFHSLRHTFVSLAVNAGVPISVVQSIVGHESNTMTRHYYHEQLPQLQSAVAEIPQIDIPKQVTITVKSDDPEIVGAGVALQSIPNLLPPLNTELK